jgi:hypothetical protein
LFCRLTEGNCESGIEEQREKKVFKQPNISIFLKSKKSIEEKTGHTVAERLVLDWRFGASSWTGLASGPRKRGLCPIGNK